MSAKKIKKTEIETVSINKPLHTSEMRQKLKEKQKEKEKGLFGKVKGLFKSK